MEDTGKKIVEPADGTTADKPDPVADSQNKDKELEVLTDKWKRALADAENARKRADAARLDGRQHGIALAVEALASAFDAVSLAIETARQSAEPDNPRIKAHLEGLESIKSAFETGFRALGVRTIAPKNTPFDPTLHKAIQTHETDEANSGNVMILHRPGFALGERLIRPAHVTVSAAPSAAEQK